MNKMADPDADRGFVVGARRLLAAKEALQASLPNGYVSDPAIVILMTMFVIHYEFRQSSHREICDAVTIVPFSVTTRWMRAIENDGLIETLADAGEEPFVRLTDRGLKTVRATILAVGNAEKAVRDGESAYLLDHALRA